ncbi:hypothetical protein LTS18_005885, partial [Coniosporium uncinatum]
MATTVPEPTPPNGSQAPRVPLPKPCSVPAMRLAGGLIYDEAVMVKVGPDTDTATSFIMMNGVLEYHSPCFKAAFTRVFAEALKKETVFTTIEFDVFRAFRSWLYTHQIYFEEYANVARGAGSLA